MRLARPGDEDRLFALCRTAFEGGDAFGSVDALRAWGNIERACRGQLMVWGLIDGPERIEAAIGFQAARTWYGGDGDWYWVDALVYVHPAHRRGRHGQRLLKFADWWASVCGAPVMVGTMPRNRVAAKSAMFGRFGRNLGATFLVGPGEFSYAREEAA